MIFSNATWQTNLVIAFLLAAAATHGVFAEHEVWASIGFLGVGIFLADAQTASEKLLQPQLVHYGYWISGPNNTGTIVTNKESIEPEIACLVKLTGFDDDDFTCTELFVKMYGPWPPIPR